MKTDKWPGTKISMSEDILDIMFWLLIFLPITAAAQVVSYDVFRTAVAFGWLSWTENQIIGYTIGPVLVISLVATYVFIRLLRTTGKWTH